VVCLNPMSAPAPAGGGSAGDRIGALLRGAAQRRLAHELRKLREAGTETLVIEPTPQDLQVMGWNPMARGRRVEVVETALRTTAMALRAARGTGQRVPERSPRTRRWAPTRAVPAVAAAATA
jgi:NTE family protein